MLEVKVHNENDQSHKSINSDHYIKERKGIPIIKRLLTWLLTGELEPGMETKSYPSYFGKIQRLINFDSDLMRHFLALFVSNTRASVLLNNFSIRSSSVGFIIYLL
jgi:hypothetical protein